MRPVARWALLLVVASCGGDPAGDSTPAEPPAAPAPAVPAAAVPASPPLPGMSCGVPPVSAAAERCSSGGSSQFGDQVNAAIQRLMDQQPDIFDGIAIRDIPSYRVGVLRNLEAAGLCAQWDVDNEGHREIMVKSSNDFSEQYHVSTSSGTVRWAPGAFRATCYPANFPVNPKPLEQRGDCALPSSRLPAYRARIRWWSTCPVSPAIGPAHRSWSRPSHLQWRSIHPGHDVAADP